MNEITIAVDEVSVLLGIAIGLGLPDLARRMLAARLTVNEKPEDRK